MRAQWASTTQAALTAALQPGSSLLWNDTWAMANACSEGSNKLPDVWGTLLAVSLGLLSGKQAEAAVAAVTAPTTGVFAGGQARHLPVPLTWGLCFGGGCTGPGTYQNGGFWATPAPWIVDGCVFFAICVCVRVCMCERKRRCWLGCCVFQAAKDWTRCPGCPAGERHTGPVSKHVQPCGWRDGVGELGHERRGCAGLRCVPLSVPVPVLVRLHATFFLTCERGARAAFFPAPPAHTHPAPCLMHAQLRRGQTCCRRCGPCPSEPPKMHKCTLALLGLLCTSTALASALTAVRTNGCQ
jgi:hypothetical protein